MKIPFLSVGLSLVLLGTTFCSTDRSEPTPTPAGTGTTDVAAVAPPQSGTPIGFNPQTCGINPNGVDAFVYNEARTNAYNLNGSQVSASEFASLQASVSAQSTAVDANGHVYGTPYDTRLNNFADGVKAQMDEYNYYVYYASLHGSDVQNAEEVKGIIQEQFDLTIPVQPGEAISQAAQTEITLLTSAARPQLAHAMDLFGSLYQCEGVSYRPAQTTSATPKMDEAITFKQFLKMRKAGQIKNFAGQVAQRSFWGFLKKAVHIVVSVAVYTIVGVFTDGPKIQKAACGSTPPPSCTTAAYFIAAAGGFFNGILKVANGNCIFGGC